MGSEMCIRDSFGPQGVLGGADGACNAVTVWQGGAAHVPEHLSKEQDIAMCPGDRVHVRTPGGGGYGDPFTRDPAAVARDVALGYYTAAQAKDLFGVCLTEGRVDPAATAVHRTRRPHS